MKNKKVIDNLKLLQTVQPDKLTLQKIHKQVISQKSGTHSFEFGFRKWFRLTPLIPLIGFTVVCIFIVAAISFSPEFHEVIVSVKIALAPNHYEKAKIALRNVHDQIYNMQSDPFNESKLTLLSDSLILTNTEMSGLQLVGEKGKYTSYQCLDLYEAYHNDLKKLNISLKSHESDAGNSLDTKVNLYDLQAKRKLKNYDNKTWKKNENS